MYNMDPLAGGCRAVAVFGVVRLGAALAAQIFVEQLIDQPADVFKDVAAAHIVLVELRAVGDVEIVAAAAVPFGVDAVERQ